MYGEWWEEVGKLQRERDGRDSVIGTTDSSVDQQHRTTFRALKRSRSSPTPAISMDSWLLVYTASGVYGREAWALAFGGGRVRGTRITVEVCMGNGWRRWNSRRKSETAGTLS